MMTDQVFFHCPNCEMGFHSKRLLEKHMEKFCIGGETAAINDVRNQTRQALQKRKESKKTNALHGMLQGPKAGSKPQSLHLRSFDDTAGVSDNQALTKLTEEFHKLRMSLEDTLPTYRDFQKENDNSHHILYQQEYWQRQQHMAEAHERQLADIQARNHYLEQQKDEIRKRLSELKLGNSATSHIEQLLVDLKTQEGKNQLALDALQKQMRLLQATSKCSKADLPTHGKTDSVMDKMGEKVTVKSLSFPAVVGPLSSEIQAFYLTYLQSGGSDHNILSQLYELQVEATALEKAGMRSERKGRKKKHESNSNIYPWSLDAELLKVELENQRLEDEIFKSKILRDKRRMDDNDLDKELNERQCLHTSEIAQLHAEIGRLRHVTARMKSQWPRQGSPPLLPPPVAPSLPPPPQHHLGLPDPAFPTSNMEPMGSSVTALGQYFLDPADALGPAPYDPASGFVIFYDFLLGLDHTLYLIRLVSGLYRNGQEMCKPSSLPIVSSDMGVSSQYVMDRQRGSCAILAARQPVPRVLPSTAIALVTELQASGGVDAYGQEIHSLAPRGWAKINIFDHLHQVMSGHWKIPIRVLPVKPGFTAEQLNGVPQAGKAELYLRLVNARDGDMQSMAEIHPGNAPLYKYPPTATNFTASPKGFPPAQRPLHSASNRLSFSVSPSYPVSVDPLSMQEKPHQRETNHRGSETSLQRLKPHKKLQPQQGNRRQQNEERLLGFILDRVKGAPQGDGAIRLTGYHQKTGQVIGTRNSGLNYCTNAVRSNIKHGYFVFGEQEVTFWDVVPQEDMILVARFYHWPSGRTAPTPWDRGDKPQHQPLLGSEKWLVAWAVLRLTKLSESCKVMPPGAGAGAMEKGEPEMFIWNTGTLTLTLYHGPVPPVATFLVMPTERKHHDFKIYGDATLRLHIFGTQKPELPFPPESPPVLDCATSWPREAFILHVRERPPLEPFTAGDGFDLYIDGARCLPDDVTVTRVVARIFTSSFNQIGPDISTGIDLNSSIFDPFYNYATEIQEPAITPCATLLLKVYSIDPSTFNLILIGWAALNLFLECGTHTAPEPGAKGIQVSLNDGAHQLRIFHNSPQPDQPFSTRTLASPGRYVPCATLLIRLFKTPMKSSHQTLQRNTVPQRNRVKLDFFQGRPDYSAGVYYSESAKPNAGESCLYEALANRSVVSVREIVHQLAKNESLSTDDEISAWICQKLTRIPSSSPQPFNLTYVSRYIATYGIKFAVDQAMNVPWTGLTKAHFCLNPPGAFYFGSQWLKYDYPIFVTALDINSYQQWPIWLDGFKSCPHRVYHEYLTVIIHLYQTERKLGRDALDQDDVQTPQRVILKGEELHHTLGSEAWTALPVFSRGYCTTGVFQLPLYQGAPNQRILASLSHIRCNSIMKSLLDKKMIYLIPGASVIVRIADGRWDELTYTAEDIDRSYLPKKGLDLYSKEPSGVKIAELMPKETSQKLARLFTLDQV